MLRIKNLSITGPLFLAPMAGYTDSPFRRIARRNGASCVFTELVSAEGLVRASRKTHELLQFTEEERPIGIQLFGSDPDVLGEAARKAADLAPDFIDINMGCSVPRVCGSGAGAAMLADPARAGVAAAAVVRAVSLPVSAKIRIGLDESRKNYREVAERLQDAGVAFITVHGRTRAQRFAGQADWTIIGEIAAHSRVPVIGNGDISSYAEARMRLETSGCAAVMIGRAAQGNPWIFTGREPSRHDFVEMIMSHLSLMQERYAEYGVILFRKHIVKYIRGINDAVRARKALMAALSYEEIRSIVEGLAA